MKKFHNRKGGFTLIELMIVVAIIGILASVGIPLFARYQLRSKSSEVKTNLSAIRVVEEAYFSENGAYLAANAEPAVLPGADKAPFDFQGSDFRDVGWSPEGNVYFSYAVAVSADDTGFTADAAADIDGDGIPQIWGYVKPDELGGLVNGALGCNAATIRQTQVDPCFVGASTF